MSFGAKLRELRRINGYTQAEFAKMLDVSSVTVSAWENDRKKPSIDALQSIAHATSSSTDELLGLQDAPAFGTPQIFLSFDEEELLNRFRRLDLFGKKAVSSVAAIEAERCDAEREPVRQIPLYVIPSAAGFSAPLDGEDCEMLTADSATPGRADFAVRIQGDSMEPTIADGSIVYVQKTEELKPNEIGIFSVDGAMYCKRYCPQADGSLVLKSDNSDRQDANVILAADSGSFVKVCGRVV